MDTHTHSTHTHTLSIAVYRHCRRRTMGFRNINWTRTINRNKLLLLLLESDVCGCACVGMSRQLEPFAIKLSHCHQQLQLIWSIFLFGRSLSFRFCIWLFYLIWILVQNQTIHSNEIRHECENLFTKWNWVQVFRCFQCFDFVLSLSFSPSLHVSWYNWLSAE